MSGHLRGGSPIVAASLLIFDLTTFPAPSGFADTRPRNSGSVAVTVDRPPCGSTSNVTVEGTELEPRSLAGKSFPA
jgi:hypothetical protein